MKLKKTLKNRATLDSGATLDNFSTTLYKLFLYKEFHNEAIMS